MYQVYALLLSFLLFHNVLGNAAPGKIRAAYWPSFAAEQYPASSVNSKLFTHLLYAFANLNSTTNTVKADEPIKTFSRTVKARNPMVKTLISIGGGASDPVAYANMAANVSSRTAFIWSSIALARRNRFDGLDLDWEFPRHQQDQDNLGMLFAEWRAAIVKESWHSGLPQLLLTAAVYYAGNIRFVGGGTYPTKSINKNLDWVGIMAFDYHGSWEPKITGAHTALYDPTTTVNTNNGVQQWFQAGLRPDKAILGLAMYGHSWRVEDANKKVGIGASAVAAGPGDATPIYNQIIEMVKNDTHAVIVYDNVTVTAYVQVGNVWVGFDNEESIKNKVSFLKNKGMKGYFFWAASYDTHTWSLSRTASAALGC